METELEPGRSTLIWKAAVSGSATLGPVAARGRWGSAVVGAAWRPERFGRRRKDEDAAGTAGPSGDAGGDGSCSERVSEGSSASVSFGTGAIPSPPRGLCEAVGVRGRAL